jgi:vancomycin resistance protein YoaR
VLGALGGVLLVVLGLVFAGSPTTLAAGTQIAGVDLGGRTPAAARAELRRRAEAVESVPIRFVAGGRSWELAALQLGVRVDWGAAVRGAMADGSGFGPVRGFKRLQTRVFGAEIAPAVSAFESVVSYTVAQMAKAVDRPAVEPAVRRRGLSVVVTPGRQGAVLDQEAAAEAVVRSLATLERGAPVALPVVTDEPGLMPEQLEPAASAARVALSAPLTLTAGATRWRLPRWRTANLLRLPAGGATELAIGGKAADRWLAELARRVNRAPRDATFRVVPGGIEVVPARQGRTLDVDATRAAVLRAAASPDRRVVALPVAVAEPERTTQDARAMGIGGVVGSYTTTYGGTPGRLANVQLVAELIDGALVAPGATFSFNATTGERNAAKGFQTAPVIINGELQDGIGGGVCQVSTTVFNAAFEAGLPIGRRTNHALYIDHYPLGRDATVNYPDLDLTFSNDTRHWLLVRTFVGSGSLTVNLYGTPVDRRVESETAPLRVTGPVPIERVEDPTLERGKRLVEEIGSPPRETSVTRRVLAADGALLHENTWASYYVAEPRIVRVGTKPKPEAAPKGKGNAQPKPGVEAPGAGSDGEAGPATPADRDVPPPSVSAGAAAPAQP